MQTDCHARCSLTRHSRHWDVVALLAVMTIAILIRASIDFSTPLMPKVNGAYYLVQARSVAEKGRLAFNAFPLVFWLSGGLARILHLLFGGDLSDSVILACKLVDSILPALTCVPIYLLTHEWTTKQHSSLWLSVIAALFCVVYYPALIMTSDFQKNAVGMVWFAFLIYCIYQGLKKPRLGHLLAIGMFLFLGSITHVGAFGAVFAYSLAALAVLLFLKRSNLRAVLVVISSATAVYVLVLGLSHFIAVPRKVEMVLDVFIHPVQLFDNSIVSSLLSRKGPRLHPLGIFNIVLIDSIAIMSTWMVLRKRGEISLAQTVTVISAIIMCIVLASPLTDWEIGAGRLLLMGYLPASVLIAFLMHVIGNRKQMITFATVVLLITLGSAAVVLGPLTATSIPGESLQELRQLRGYVSVPEGTLVIARHGLEWWAAWVLRTHVSQEYHISREMWDRYETVLFLRQIADHAPFGPMGFGGPPFQEVQIPREADVLFEGHYYLLATSDVYPDFYPLARPHAK
jgi:hypothetical protein